MTRHCLNCGHPVKEKYCPQCSQSTDVARITWKSFGADFIHTFMHAERGIFGTTWQMFKNPGKVLDEYLGGKRKKYQQPVSFFAIWVTVCILIHRSLVAYSGFHPVYLEGLTFKDPESIRAFITHGELFYIISFPVSAGIFYFVLGRPLYTYIECIVINMYGFSLSFVTWILCYLIGGFLLSFNVLHWGFYLLQISIALFYIFYICWSLFRTKPIKFLLLRILLYTAINAIVTLRLLEWISIGWVRVEEWMHY